MEEGKLVEDMDWNDFFGKGITDVLPYITNEEDEQYQKGFKFEYSDSIYYKFHKRGFELCFNKIEGSGSTALSHVVLYSEGVENFSEFKGKLPYNLQWEMKKNPKYHSGESESDLIPTNNTMIVRRFGDTTIKGGGKVNVFMTYNEAGIGFTFMN
eukprot:CAMPEP_0205804960 /NCGR_PEP_ID=MMETSP0205-20121125/8020_1 /ASSEMBLY_ACC=CAM_ASM_000278 /TAXON_ID=36767 /ORGANISM="Euplotes focardii, Strain TN1" /LENGTH=154 /DNA_ID=CAMNT_0053075373 /DNA_START=3 /DNA_END=467 /DNA_ORIENTATION=+